MYLYKGFYCGRAGVLLALRYTLLLLGALCIQIITQKAWGDDTIPPVINCPEPLTILLAEDECTTIAFYEIDATDETSTVTVVSQPPSGTTFEPGIHDIHSTATDAAGNFTTCSFSIIVAKYSSIHMERFPQSTDHGFRIEGAQERDQLGYSVSRAGDVNNDGFDDVIASAPFANDSDGKSWVIFGKSNRDGNLDLRDFVSSDSTGFRIDGGHNFYAGLNVATAGDVNGDGFDDIIVGAHNTASFGRCYVIFGKASGFTDISLTDFRSSDTLGFRVRGEDTGDALGIHVAPAGDFNKDGYDDIIVSDPFLKKFGRSTCGGAYVIFGKASGFKDIELTNWVLSPSASTGFAIYGAAAADNLGRRVASAGDVNNDGFDDIIVGAYAASNNGRHWSGSSYVIFGKASGFATMDLASFTSSDQTGFQIDGATANEFFGSSAGSIGDYNRDGFGDFIVTAPADTLDSGYYYSGTNYVFFGRAGGFTKVDLAQFVTSNSTGFRITGPESWDWNSKPVAVGGVFDANHDGLSDILLSVPCAEASYVIFGHSHDYHNVDLDFLTTSSSAGFRIYGAGESSSVVGDMDQDGFADIVLGTYLADPNDRLRSGLCYVVFGGIGHPCPPCGLIGPRNVRARAEIGKCGANVSYSMQMNGKCACNHIVYDPPSGSFFPIGYTSVTVTLVTDECDSGDHDGLSNSRFIEPVTSCTLWVNVDDSEWPVVSMPLDMTVIAKPGEDSAVVTYEITATDACEVTLDIYPVSGSTFPIGTTPVSVVATDTLGHSSTRYFQVTVIPGSCPDKPELSLSWRKPVRAASKASAVKLKGVLQIQNAGDVQSGPFTVEMYISPTPDLNENAVPFLNKTVKNLKPGKRFPIKLPAKIKGLDVPENSFVITVVDRSNIVDECNETNSVLTAQLQQEP